MSRVLDLAPDRFAKINLFNLKVGVEGYAAEQTELGTTVVRAVEVFKAGSFKDSMGDERTWTVDQLAMMVSNFNLLRDTDRFPNVPIRRDHSWSMDGVIGWFEGLAVSGDRLVADLEFTEPEDFEKFERGTYRSRSIEIGAYEDNDGVMYWPVVMGLAFVDIPAVEGLHRAAKQRVASYSLQRTKEPTVPDTKPDEQKLFVFSLNGQDTTDYAAVSKHLKKLEGDNETLKARNETLETFAKEQTKANRHNFVTGLAESRRIAATQIDGLKTLVETMSDEQWDGFKAAYENAPKMTLLEDHAGATGNNNADGEGATGSDEVSILEETIAMHRRAGLSDEQIARTPTHKRLLALKGA